MPRHATTFAPIPAAHPLADPVAWGSPTDDRALSMREACEFIRVSRTEMYRLMNDGLVRPVKHKGRLRFARRKLREYLASLARD